MKKVTLKEVAKEAGVSVMSVSKALNDREGLSDETRRRILEIAARMNYSQNQVAKSLRTDVTKTIGVVLSDSAEVVTAKVLRGIQDEARGHGYSVIISNTDNRHELEHDAIQALIDKRIDGIILVAPKFYSEDSIRWIKGFGIPVVITMRHGENGQNMVDSVLNNNVSGGYEVVKHLLGQGCRHFAFLHLKNSQSSRERSDGYAKALQEAGLKLESFLNYEVEPSIEAGSLAAARLLRETEPVDAVVCGCDTVAIGVIEALHAAEVQIPDEICVTGYDGIEFGAYLKTPLTTIAQPLYEIGVLGTQMLMERIKNPAIPKREVMLQSKLTVRESSMRVTKRGDAAKKNLTVLG